MTRPGATSGLAARPVRARRTAHLAPSMRHRGRRDVVISRLLFALPATVFLVVLSIYPMYILVQMSVSDVTIHNLLGYWPIVGFQNFRSVLASGTFHTVALQTLIFVLAILVITVVLGFLIAIVLRPESRFGRVTQTTLILVWTLPPVIIGSLWKFLLASDGPANRILTGLHVVRKGVPFLSQPVTSLGAIAAVSLWVGLPFAALVMKSAILDIPVELNEAARIDGATPWQVVGRITLPMIRPTILILAVLSVVGAFKGFDFIYVMTSGGPGTSSTTVPYLGYLTAFQEYQFGTAAAISVLAMVVVLALAVGYIFALRAEDR